MEKLALVQSPAWFPRASLPPQYSAAAAPHLSPLRIQVRKLRSERTGTGSEEEKWEFNKAEFMNYVDEEGSNGEEGELDEMEERPWEGAIIFKRCPSNTHLEYCTTLERLGMSHLSSPLSHSSASSMGLRVTTLSCTTTTTTPVQVSLTALRKKKKWRLDGIIRTVLSLSCIICDEGAAKPVFLNFSMLLCDDPVEEEELLEVVGPWKKAVNKEDDEDIDWDDRLYFPPGQREVDITKPIRDLVFLEDTLDVICLNPNCAQISSNNDSFYKVNV